MFPTRRRVHVGDPYVRSEAVPGGAQQRRHREDRERGAASPAPQLPPSPLQPHVTDVVLRAIQETLLQGDEACAQVSPSLSLNSILKSLFRVVPVVRFWCCSVMITY